MTSKRKIIIRQKARHETLPCQTLPTCLKVKSGLSLLTEDWWWWWSDATPPALAEEEGEGRGEVGEAGEGGEAGES